jgi:hypothetical protein
MLTPSHACVCKRRSESAARIGLKVQRSGLKESIVIGLEGD